MQDCCGDGGHLNHSGVTKLTLWLEKYIDEYYDLPDRRGDSAYKIYEEGVERLNECTCVVS